MEAPIAWIIAGARYTGPWGSPLGPRHGCHSPRHPLCSAHAAPAPRISQKQVYGGCYFLESHSRRTCRDGPGGVNVTVLRV